MEHIKIINLPIENEEDKESEEFEEVGVEEVDDESYQPPKKGFIFLIVILIAALIGVSVYLNVQTYQDFETKASYNRVDSAETSYVDFKSNILKYSSDGVFYTTYSGNLIWNYTYNMTSPQCDVCKDYVIIYDKKGNEIDIFNSTGIVKSISTNTPIVEAQVAAQGTVAVLLQENNTSFIRMYDKKGNLLVGGEMHPENSGYPISIAISSDATKLLVSLLNLNDGNIKNVLQFYDFSSAGKAQMDNIAATYNYIDMIFPQVDFVNGDKAIAFGDHEIVVFNNNFECTIAKEVFFTEELKSVFYNDKYYGYICEAIDETGTISDQLNVYNLSGFRCCQKNIDDSYSRVELLSNNEVALYNGNVLSIYNRYGINRFKYDFSDNVYELIPGGSSRRYIIIEETETNEVKIR